VEKRKYQNTSIFRRRRGKSGRRGSKKGHIPNLPKERKDSQGKEYRRPKLLKKEKRKKINSFKLQEDEESRRFFTYQNKGKKSPKASGF